MNRMPRPEPSDPPQAAADRRRWAATSMQSLLSDTGEQSKLRHAGLCVAFAIMVSPVHYYGHQWFGPGMVEESAGLAVVVLWGVALVLACRIRCPECGLRWFLYAIRKESIGEWLPWLRSFSVCPRCGFSCSQARRDAHAA
jgi:hypothetical protein